MALVRRVNNSLGFVLNTFHCKCIVNIKRLKKESDIMRYSNLAGAEILKDYQTFAEMIKFRQSEAKKSVIIKMSEVSHIEHLKNFCKCYAKIVNIFPYSTMDNNKFVLMECNSDKDVEALRKVAVCKADPEYAHSVTPLFLYKPQHKLYTNKNTLNKDSYEYLDNFKTPNLDKISQSLKKIQSVSNQMIFLYDTLRITELNIRLRFYTAAQISYYLSKLFVNLSVVPFGSSVNGFGQIGCDLDLLCKTNISSNDNSTGFKKFLFMTRIVPLTDRNEQKQFLDVIGTIMKTCIPGIIDVKKILEARVPIIKFCNLNTNMQCDFSSTNMTALHMSELLYLYGQLDWRVKPLVFTIRKWARSMNLTKENPGQWITNFSLTLLILFYLQTKNVLPSLTSIKMFMNDKEIDNFNWFLKWKNSVSNNDESLSKLLHEFFEYYSFFDFKTQAVCLRDGVIKLKKNSSPLYIFNPFNPSLNVSKNVTISELMRLTGHFQRAFQIMLNSTEQDTIVKLINFDSNSTINNGFNNQNKSKSISEKFIPNVTDINNLQKIEKSIIK